MKYFLDSAKLDEIKLAYNTFGIDGVTTNPRHIMLSGKPFLTAITDIANWIKEEGLEGYDKFPVSVEINPHLDDTEEMIAAARKVSAICSNFVIKIPCTEAGVEVLAKLSGNNLTDGATKAMEDLLSAYPDQIDIVLCHNDDTAIGAMNACKSAGVSDITIVGFDGNASAVKLILDGELVKATVAQQPYEMGYQVVEAAVKAVKLEPVDEVINAPVQVVTAENGQAYLDNLEAMKG
mgnify:FL=1